MHASRICLAWKHISEFDIKYYALMTVLLVSLMAIIIHDFNQWINFSALFIVILLMVSINKHEVKTVIKILREKLVRK